MDKQKEITIYIADDEEAFLEGAYVIFKFNRNEKDKIESLIDIANETEKFIRVDILPKIINKEEENKWKERIIWKLWQYEFMTKTH